MQKCTDAEAMHNRGAVLTLSSLFGHRGRPCAPLRLWISACCLFTGGFGIYKAWLGDGLAEENWRDTNFKVTGPAVAEMQQAFAENWVEEGGSLLPDEDFPRADPTGKVEATFVTSTSSDHLTRAERLMQLSVAAATKRLWIGNA